LLHEDEWLQESLVFWVRIYLVVEDQMGNGYYWYKYLAEIGRRFDDVELLGIIAINSQSGIFIGFYILFLFSLLL
jgi:hypothetical protein